MIVNDQKNNSKEFEVVIAVCMSVAVGVKVTWGRSIFKEFLYMSTVLADIIVFDSTWL